MRTCFLLPLALACPDGGSSPVDGGRQPADTDTTADGDLDIDTGTDTNAKMSIQATAETGVTGDTGPVDEPPTFDMLPPVRARIDLPVVVLLTVEDEDVGTVTVTVSSDNQAVVADANLALEGTGATRDLKVTPSGIGAARLIVVATDAGGQVTEGALMLSVGPDRSAWTETLQYDHGDPDQASDTQAHDVAIGPEGHGRVVGFSYQEDQAHLMRVDPNGEEVWTHFVSEVLVSYGQDVAVRPDGTSVFTARSDVNAFEYEGQQCVVSQVGPYGTSLGTLAVVGDYSGDLYNPCRVALAEDGSVAMTANSIFDAAVSRTDAAGGFAFLVEVADGEPFLSGVATAGDDTVFAGFSRRPQLGAASATGQDGFVGMLDSSGNALWAAFVDGPGDQNLGGGVDVDGDGNIYVCGSTTHALEPGHVVGGEEDWFVRSYDAYGIERWTAEGGGAQGDACLDIHVGEDGQIYVAGSTDQANSGPDLPAGWMASFTPDGVSNWSTEIRPQPNTSTYTTGIAQSGLDVIAVGRTTGDFSGGPPPYGGRGFVMRLDAATGVVP